MADLEARAARARRWLFEDAFPLWSSAGFDARTGQFVEQLTLAGEPLTAVPRRVIVQARQLYVFATAGRMGWDGPWRAVATAAAEALLARGRTDDGDWIFAFDGQGRPSDLRLDLYTQAFAIFGLTHAATALDRADLLDAARATRVRLELAWRAPAGGFVEGALFPGVRRQNPHMHLFEAVMALHAATGDAADAALAAALWSLFKDRFAAEAGVLEYFDEALVPLAGDRGRVTEPGHAFEWAWLAGRWGRRAGTDESAVADRLYAIGRRGVGPGGAACDEVWTDGTIKTASARCWPQTEYLKAALARLARTGATADAAAAAGAHDALLAYLAGVRPGAWRDRRLADGGWAEGPAPASSGYHIVCALNELIART
jgi:mannose/cellobiose epimerase-like protein (N-acyl-D-glucosamine 2-epimerase family)